MKSITRMRASVYASLSIVVLSAILAALPVLAHGQAIGQSSRLAAQAAGGGLEVAADLTGAEVVSIDIAGPGTEVVHTESKESPVWLPAADLADGSCRFEVQLVDAGTGRIVDRLAGVFTVRNGQVVVPVQKRDKRTGGLLPAFAEALNSFAGWVSAFFVTEAEAADLTVSDAGSADLFIDVTNVGTTADWDVDAVGCASPHGSCFEVWSYAAANWVLQFRDSPNVDHSFLVDDGGDIHFANESMLIDRGNSRLGIGTITPAYDLDVVGDRVRLRNNTTATARTVMLRADGLATDLEAQNADLWIRADLPAPAHNIYMLSNKIGVGTTAPSYKLTVSGEGTDRSTLHFTNDGRDVGGWLTSVADNNFFVSSGAMWNGAGWVQKSPDGKAVMAGSGPAGYRVFMTQGAALGGTIALGTPKLHINYAGQVGINTGPVAGRAITTSTGGYLSSTGFWVNGSSRQYKDNIRELSAVDATQALKELNPVTFTSKANPSEQHVGFIAEDVPALVATPDRKGLIAMDIVAVLTKVVKEQQALMSEKDARIEKLERNNERITKALEKLASQVAANDGSARKVAAK